MRIQNKKTRYKKAVCISIIIALVLVAALLLWRNQTQKADDTTSTALNRDTTAEPDSSIPTPDPVVETPPAVAPDKSMLVENEQYKIRYDKDSKTYTITLYAIINNPSQYEMYQSQLREYKQNALQYLQDQGIDSKNAKVVYEPEEAKDL